LIANKAVTSSVYGIEKVEYDGDYEHSENYAIYGWLKWNDNIQ